MLKLGIKIKFNVTFIIRASIEFIVTYIWRLSVVRDCALKRPIHINTPDHTYIQSTSPAAEYFSPKIIEIISAEKKLITIEIASAK